MPRRRPQSGPESRSRTISGTRTPGIGCSERVREVLLRRSFCADGRGFLKRVNGNSRKSCFTMALCSLVYVQQLQLFKHLRLSPLPPFSARQLRAAASGLPQALEGSPSRPPALPAPEGAKRLYGERDCGIKPNSRGAAHRSGALRGGVAPLGWVTEDRVLCGLKSGKGLLPSRFHCVIMCTQ